MNRMEDLFIFDKGEFFVAKKNSINIESRFFASELSKCCPNVTIKSAFKEIMCIRFNFPQRQRGEATLGYFCKRDVV